MRALGRNRPDDLSHVAAFPFAAVSAQITKPTPVVGGTDWYTSFDVPVLGTDGKYRVSITPGAKVRGGHCYCFEPVGEPDIERNWVFYDQGEEGACEGFGHSRAMTLLSNHVLFDAFLLYDDARRIEGTYPTGEGATNEGACNALRKYGDFEELKAAPVINRAKPSPKTIRISSFHWATTAEEIRQALGYPSSVGEIPFLNSWGKQDYPHRTYMSLDEIATLLSQGGEYDVPVPIL